MDTSIESVRLWNSSMSISRSPLNELCQNSKTWREGKGTIIRMVVLLSDNLRKETIQIINLGSLSTNLLSI